jgi:hypothetical protein
MGKFLAALFSLVLGVALGAAGIPAWVAMALYRSEVALGWAVWLVERSPLPLYAPAVQVANDAIRHDSLVAEGLVAAVLCLAAFSLLRFVRRALRAANESHDGKGTLELKTRPLRVGRPVEGNIWLTHGSARDALYRVELSCKRDHGSGRSEASETPYFEELEVAPVRTPVGWSLPFRFVVPPIAPPSGASYVSGPGYSWRLAFRRSKSWISSPSVFTLKLAAAPPEQLRPLEKRETPAQKQPIEDIVRSVGKEPVLRELARLREPSVADLRIGIGGAWNRGPDSLGMRPEPDVKPQSPARSDPREVTGTPLPLSGDPLTPPDSAPNLFADATRGGVRAYDAAAYDRSTDLSEGAGLPGKIVKWLFLVLFGGVLAVSAVALATAVLLRHIM